MLLSILVLAALSVSAQKELNFTVKAGVGLAHVVGSDADTKVNRLDPNFRQYNQTFDIVVGYRF